jgi:hypothetical protein
LPLEKEFQDEELAAVPGANCPNKSAFILNKTQSLLVKGKKGKGKRDKSQMLSPFAFTLYLKSFGIKLLFKNLYRTLRQY